MSLRSDDLDSVGELYSEDNFRQLVMTVEAATAFLGGLGELEDHGECGLVGETSLGADRAVADRCEPIALIAPSRGITAQPPGPGRKQ